MSAVVADSDSVASCHVCCCGGLRQSSSYTRSHASSLSSFLAPAPVFPTRAGPDPDIMNHYSKDTVQLGG